MEIVVVSSPLRIFDILSASSIIFSQNCLISHGLQIYLGRHFLCFISCAVSVVVWHHENGSPLAEVELDVAAVAQF